MLVLMVHWLLANCWNKIIIIWVLMLLKVCSFICYKNYHCSQLYNFFPLIDLRLLGLNHLQICLLWYFWSMVKQNSVGNFMLSELELFLSNKMYMKISFSVQALKEWEASTMPYFSFFSSLVFSIFVHSKFLNTRTNIE